MILGRALDAGLGAVGTLLECTRVLVDRLAARVLPLARRAVERLGAEPQSLETPTEATPARPGGPQDEVEGAKYYLGPAAEPAGRPPAAEPAGRPSAPAPAPERVVGRELAELPRAYGDDRLVLLVRDPWWVYAYWEVTPNTRIAALRELGAEAEGARELVRVYDVTFITFTGDNAWRSFDVEITPGADHWYVNVGRPATSFCAELGLLTPAGRFRPLVRSNTVTTPRSSPSPDTSVRWVELRPNEPPVETRAAWNGGRVPGPAGTAATTGPSPVDERPRSSDVHAGRSR
ncbi:MAG TPA: DUF4912 domain-containing protein [Candidatus Binatia bacterium]|nr:DUF4912 domain-containing protein [Candidatus Binatia bacterium]